MALKDDLKKINAEIEKISRELGKQKKVFDTSNLEQAQTYLKGLNAELAEMNSDLSFIVGSFRDSVNELSKQNTELTNAKSSLRKISSISSQLLDLRNETTVVDEARIEKLERQARLEFDSLKVSRDIGGLSKEQTKEIEDAINRQETFLAGLQKIKDEQKAIRESFGVGTFGFLGDLSQAIPGLGTFTDAFRDAEEAAVGNVKANELLKKINLETGAGLNATTIEQLGLTEQLKDADGNILEGRAAAEAIAEKGLKGQLKGQNTLLAGTKALGAGLKAAFGPLAVFLALADAILKANEQQVELRKSTMMTQEEALAFRGELQTAVFETESLNNAFKANVITTSALLENFNNLNKQFGFIFKASTDTLVTLTKLTKAVKLSEEAAGGLAALSVSSGVAFEDGYKNALLTSFELQRQVGVQFDLRQILEETANVTGAVRANLGGNIEAIAEAVTQAKLFGASLEDVAAAGQALLDFESSIRAELEAELLIGKDLNLERARAAALAGDQVTLAKELQEQAGDFEEFSKLNVIQQEALAGALGMQSDQLADILFQQDIQGKTAQELRAAGKDELANRLEQKTAADEFNATIAKFKDLLVDVFAALEPILGLFTGILNIVSFILSPLTALIGWANQFGSVMGLIVGLLAAASIAAVALGSGLTLGFGIPLILTGIAAGFALVNKLMGEAKADDLYAPAEGGGGYGKRMLIGPEGAIALNNKDTVIAGTNLFPKADDLVTAGAGDIQLPDNSTGKETNKLLSTLIKQNSKKPEISPVGLYSVQ